MQLNRRNFLHLLTAGAASAVLPRPAFSMVVFDPSNFSQNTISAVQNVMSVVNQIKDYMLQIQQYMTMLQNLKSIGPGAILGLVGAQMKNELGIQGNETIAQLMDAGKGLYNTYKAAAGVAREAQGIFQQAQNFGNTMSTMAATTGMSWPDILKAEMSRVQAGKQAAAMLGQEALAIKSAITANGAKAQAVMEQAGNAEGALQAMQSVVAMGALTNQQLGDLTSAVASQAAASHQAGLQKLQDDERRRADAAAQADAYTKFLQGLGK